MNLEELKAALLAAARSEPEDDRVPLAFEKRVMANLAAAPGPDPVALWSRALWRAAAPCMAVSLLLAVWTVAFAPAPQAAAVRGEEIPLEVEQVVLAPLDRLGEEYW